MPLNHLQSRIMRLIAVNRTPASYIAGGAPVAAVTDRFSGDFDIFQDPDAPLDVIARADARALEDNGMTVMWSRRGKDAWTAEVKKGTDTVRLEWRNDSAFRFFPTQPDLLFGYVLHPADQITNKLLTIADRKEARDVFDVIALSSRVPITAAIIAAPGKDAGYNPTSLLAAIRRNIGHPQDAFDRLRSIGPIDGGQILRDFRLALDQAADVVETLPLDAIGCFHLEGGRIVVPDPLHLSNYVAERGGIKGIVPEIDAFPFGSWDDKHQGR